MDANNNKTMGHKEEYDSTKDVKYRMGIGTSLAVQWLRLCASNEGSAGSIPGWGTKIPHTAWRG